MPAPDLVYCLRNRAHTKTYVGCTNNFPRRLRQHNGALRGGARYTRGDEWHAVAHVTNFETRTAALQFEWAWKHVRARAGGKGAAARLRKLETLLRRDKWCDVVVLTNFELAAAQEVKPLVC